MSWRTRTQQTGSTPMQLSPALFDQEETRNVSPIKKYDQRNPVSVCDSKHEVQLRTEHFAGECSLFPTSSQKRARYGAPTVVAGRANSWDAPLAALTRPRMKMRLSPVTLENQPAIGEVACQANTLSTSQDETESVQRCLSVQ
jgi:hypothetical protein